MNCRELDAFLEARGSQPLSETAERHLSTCAACRRLVAVWESARSEPSFAPAESALPVGILEDLAPVRPLPRASLLMLSAIAAAALVCAVGIAFWGLAGWEAQTTVERVILFAAVAGALLASAYRLSMEMIPGSKPGFDWRWIEAGAFAAFLLTVLIAFHHLYSFDMRAIHGECFGRGLLTAAAVLPLLWLAIRRGAFLDQKKAAIAIAILISSAALLVLTVYCPILNWAHVLVAHVGAVAAVVVAGAIIGELAQ